MDRLKIKYKKYFLHYAGYPSFMRYFARDSLISAIITKDIDMLRNDIKFCSEKQGKRMNNKTGEERGKIFHEYPGVKLRGLSTEYNACDTTALYLIAFEHYFRITKDKAFVIKHMSNIKHAVGYILRHLDNYMFFEDPKHSGAKKYALKCTYWKDAQIIGRRDTDPAYPIAYPLAHIQNMCGLKAAARLLNRVDLLSIVSKMKERIPRLFDNKNGNFYFAIDKKGKISAISSDGLNALFYLEKGEIDEKIVKGIVKSSKKLETKYGYRTLDPDFNFIPQEDTYDYPNTIWPFEQALIHIGAKKFGLNGVCTIAKRVRKYLNNAPEYILIQKRGFEEGGCNPQLWTLASKIYFDSL